MEQEQRVVNKNTLYVTSSVVLDTQAFNQYVKKQIYDAASVLTTEFYFKNVQTTFAINSPKKLGKSCKYAYIWIDSQEVVNVILGFNPDGSKRIIKTKTKLNTTDCLDDEDWYSGPVVKIEETKLPPLISIPLFIYEGKEHFVEFERFFSPLPSEEFRRDSLICLSVPEEIDNNAIYNVFSRYGTKSDPRVRRFGTKVVVTFAPDTDDASFALAMQMITTIKVRDNTHILRFARNRVNKK